MWRNVLENSDRKQDESLPSYDYITRWIRMMLYCVALCSFCYVRGGQYRFVLFFSCHCDCALSRPVHKALSLVAVL